MNITVPARSSGEFAHLIGGVTLPVHTTGAATTRPHAPLFYPENSI
jgi:hypothetical protein